MKVYLLIINCVLLNVVALVDYSCLHAGAWQRSTGINSVFSVAKGITSLTYSNSNPSTPTINIAYNNIPNYDRNFTSSDIANLNARPSASTDFMTGQTTAKAGGYYIFGTNIGYSSLACNKGYWPPGPVCPGSVSTSFLFRLLPSAETGIGSGDSAGCSLTPGAMGITVHGASIYAQGDGLTYNNQNVWTNMAPSFEIYDLDVCSGHSAGASGDYHHHNYSPCEAEKLNDSGSSGHSPVYGFMGDGFPIYGPWQATGVLAQSCWQKRDYSSPIYGCAGGARTCQFINQFSPLLGTTTLSSENYGPSLTGTVTTQSRNVISAASGIYKEDYYYNSTCSSFGGAKLDSHNGHNHDNLGYHYHFTIDAAAVPQFPYTAGPNFYGCVTSAIKTRTRCSNSACSTSFGTPFASSACTSGFTISPTAAPSRPSPAPSNSPSATFTFSPSPQPTYTLMPSLSNTGIPSSSPTIISSSFPISIPSPQPSAIPSAFPSPEPSAAPSPLPTAMPSPHPTSLPGNPTLLPTFLLPTPSPSMMPSPQPLAEPSAIPSPQPFVISSPRPSANPSMLPSLIPSMMPSPRLSSNPSMMPSPRPSPMPSPIPTAMPSAAPSPRSTMMPSPRPSTVPPMMPSPRPSMLPSMSPSVLPSPMPSPQPSVVPSAFPSPDPSAAPSPLPTAMPSPHPTSLPGHPTRLPTLPLPSPSPSMIPSPLPSAEPSTIPSPHPSADPSMLPSLLPSMMPSPRPSSNPTVMPSLIPTLMPSLRPSSIPGTPSISPTPDAFYFSVSQIVNGISSSQWNLVNNVSTNEIFRTAVAIQMTSAGITAADITIDTISPFYGNKLLSLRRHVLAAADAVTVNYTVNYIFSPAIGAVYIQLSTQLTNSIISQQFTTTLQSVASSSPNPSPLATASSFYAITYNPLSFPVAPTPQPSSDNVTKASNNDLIIIIIVVAIITFCLCFICILGFIQYKKRNEQKPAPSRGVSMKTMQLEDFYQIEKNAAPGALTLSNTNNPIDNTILPRNDNHSHKDDQEHHEQEASEDDRETIAWKSTTIQSFSTSPTPPQPPPKSSKFFSFSFFSSSKSSIN